MNPFRRYIVGALALTASLTPAFEPVLAQEEPLTVRVRVETKPEPSKAVGILLSTAGARQIPDPHIQKVGDNLYEVVFAVNRDELTDDTVATAMTMTDGGDVAFANVTPSLKFDSRALVANVPECPAQGADTDLLVSQMGTLRQLVEVRETRAALLRKRVQSALAGGLHKKVVELENVFGLHYTKDLIVDGDSPEESANRIPAQELVDRLARVNFAVKKYEAFKPKPDPSAAKQK